MRQQSYELPGGYLDADGVLHREVTLSALSGREEEMLADQAGPSSPALVTAVLSQCVEGVGTAGPLSEDMARELLVGDRQFLLLKLRELTFGSRVELTVACPWPRCGKRVDIRFEASDVPVKQAPRDKPFHELELSADALDGEDPSPAGGRVTFRLPNGGDQEAVCSLYERNEAEALTTLLARCLRSVGGDDASLDRITRLSPLARVEIEAAMERLAPALELTMDTKCPECGRDFSAPFDLSDFFFSELGGVGESLHREVHYLAYHYHWSERDILAMTRGKRRKYIETLSAEIERWNDAVE